jgi:hypothetical protein
VEKKEKTGTHAEASGRINKNQTAVTLTFFLALGVGFMSSLKQYKISEKEAERQEGVLVRAD